jgi:TraG-like protein, N-terminal region
MRARWVGFGALALWPGFAGAMELDYYTYNAFDETVAAFTRLGLLFSDVNFLGFVVIFAVLGLICGALVVATKGVSGGQVSPTAWLFPILFGLVLFKGLVMPTGRLDIYDPVRNAFQPVDGVPDFVVLVAGVLNKLERGIVEMVNTATATPYDNDAGSVDFTLVNSAMSVPISDVNLDRSMSQYYSDCGTLAISVDSGGVTQQELLRGTDDQLTTWAKFANPAVYTVYYPDGTDAGQSMTCQAAWTQLSAQLRDPAKFQDMKNALCQMTGFDPTQATQMARCDAELVNAGNLYGEAAASSLVFMRSVALAKSMTEAMKDPDVNVQESMLMNRQVMAEGLGTAQAANQWIPKLRGFILATVLGLVPLVMLLSVTPIFFKTIGLVLGLFVWLTLWGICDATAIAMARDAAVSAFNDITTFHFGYDAFLNTPDATMQALAIFGKARGMAMGIATVVSGALFHFSGGYSFAQIDNGLQSQLERTGGQAGAQALLPEQRAALIESLTRAPAAQAELATAGFNTMAGSQAQSALRRDAAGEGYITRSLAQGMRPVQGLIAEGEMEGGSRVGSLEGAGAAAERRGGRALGEVAREQQYVRSAHEAGQMFGELDQAGSPGKVYGIGESQAEQRVAETQTTRELYRNINDSSEQTPQGWRNVQRQLQGTALAVSEAGSTEAYINAQRQMQLASNAAGAVAASRPGSAERTGAMRELQDILHGQAFSEAKNVVSELSLQRGMEFPLLQSAETGRAAAETGRLDDVAAETVRTQLGEQVAHAQITRRLMARFGMGEGEMPGLVAFSETREGARASLAVTPENREQIVSTLKGAGLLSDYAEGQLRRARGGEVSFSFNPATGEPVGMRVQAGAETVFATTDRSETGRSVSTFLNDSLDLTSSITGGAALLEKGALEKGYLAAYDSLASDRHDSESAGRWAAWTDSLGKGLQQLGFRADAFSGVSKTARFTVDGGVEVGAKVPLVKFGAKGGASGGWTRDSSNQTTTSQDLNTTTSQQIVEESLKHAVQEYEKTNGVGSAVSASQVDLAHRAADIAHERFESLLGAERESTHTGRESNAALKDINALPPGALERAAQATGGALHDAIRLQEEMQHAIEKSKEQAGPGFVR